MAALKEQFEVERRTLTDETRRMMEKRHSDELNRLVMQHEEELSRLRHAIDLSKLNIVKFINLTLVN